MKLYPSPPSWDDLSAGGTTQMGAENTGLPQDIPLPSIPPSPEQTTVLGTRTTPGEVSVGDTPRSGSMSPSGPPHCPELTGRPRPSHCHAPPIAWLPRLNVAPCTLFLPSLGPPNSGNFRKEVSGESPVAGGSQSHCIQREEAEEKGWFSAPFFCFTPSGIPAHKMAGLPKSVNIIETIPHSHAQIRVSAVLLNPVRLTRLTLQ